MRTLSIAAIVVLVAPLPYCARAADDKKEPTLIVFGRVVWPGLAWFPKGVVSAARDVRFRDVVANAFVSPEGRFVLALPAGEYYVRAVVDIDADGKLGPGDGIGFYGVKSKADRPARLSIRPEAPMESVLVLIAFQVTDDGKLRPAAVGAVAGSGRVVGRLAGAGERAFIVFWPVESRYTGYAVPVDEQGRFEARLTAGVYRVAAVGVSHDGRQVAWARAVNVDDGSQVTVLPQRTAELGELALGGEADGHGDDSSAAQTPVPQGIGLVRLEIAAGGPDAQAWQVMLFASEQLTGMMLKAWVWRGVWLALRPATYYVLCGADVDGDGVLGPGDALATAQGTGKIGFISVQPGEVVKAAIDKVAEIGPTLRSETKQEK